MTPKTAAVAIESGEPFSYLCMSENSYLTLGATFQDILRYVKQTNALIDYYEKE